LEEVEIIVGRSRELEFTRKSSRKKKNMQEKATVIFLQAF
jgi:hypothetical protein